MEVYERVSGARMHTAMYRPFGVGVDMMFGQACDDISYAIFRGFRLISGAFLGLLNNRAFRSRCSGIGIFSTAKVKAYGIQGVIARSSGLLVDARLGFGAEQYGLYASTSLVSFVGQRGDCYDRFVIRAREIVESFRVILQVIPTLKDQITARISSKAATRSKFSSMEAVIGHFKSSSYSPTASSGLG
jgi:NADH:ubiquinone oxidoreductase subunit D